MVKKKDPTVTEEQVKVLNVRGITLLYGMEFTMGMMPGDATPRFKYIPTDTMSNYRIDFLVTGEQNAREFAEFLPSSHIEYKIDVNGKKVLQNIISITTEDLKRTNFYVSLNGVGGGRINYVHRDQAKELLMNSKTQLSVFMQLENPSLVDNQLIDKLLEVALTQQKQSINSFSQSSADTIFFDKSDLKPDKIESSLNKDFSLSSDNKTFILNKNTSVSVGITIPISSSTAAGTTKTAASGGTENTNPSSGKNDAISAYFQYGRTYTKEEIEQKLRQHDIYAAFTGQKWIVKDVYLTLINHDFLNSNTRLSFNSQYVSEQDAEIYGVFPGEDFTDSFNCHGAITTPITTTTTTTAAPKEVLLPGEKLRAGQMLVSLDKSFRAVMQEDGNFVVYNSGNSQVWSSKTIGSAKYLELTGIGALNLVNNDTGSIFKQLFTNSKNVPIRGLYLLTNGNLLILEATGATNLIQ